MNTNHSSSSSPAVRLASLDALRGFDMFFITGGAGIIAGLCAAFGWGDGWLAQEMRHVPWAGLAHHDTIFPLFLFLAGVSWPFSLASQAARGRTTGQIVRKVILRMAILFAFGLVCGHILDFKPTFRIPSVLGQIGLSWGLAALVFMSVKRLGARILVVAGLLFGYWALLAFNVAPDAPAGADAWSLEGNIISWLDRTLMPNHIYKTGVYDPESLFSVPSGVALALLGMLAGTVLRNERWTASRRALVLAALAGLTLALGLGFVFVLGTPVVKSLWTSSFVLVAAAYSYAMLAVFYWVIDVKGWSRWSFYFMVIGMNSITIYMLMNVGVIGSLRRCFFNGLLDACGKDWLQFLAGLTQQLTCWLVLYFLYRKKIFLKV